MKLEPLPSSTLSGTASRDRTRRDPSLGRCFAPSPSWNSDSKVLVGPMLYGISVLGEEEGGVCVCG